MPGEPQYVLQDSNGNDLGVVYANESGNLVLHNAGEGDEVVLKNGGLYNNPSNGPETEFSAGQGAVKNVVGPTGNFGTIQAAVDDIEGQSGKPYGEVYVQRDYDFDADEPSRVEIGQEGIRIRGETMTRLQSGDAEEMFYVSTTAEHGGGDSNRPPGVVIQGFRLDHPADADTIVNNGSAECAFKDLVIRKGGVGAGRGMYTNDNDGADNVNTTYLENVKIYNVGGKGYESRNAEHNLTVVGCKFLNCGDEGFAVNHASSVAIYGSVFEDCSGPGLYLKQCDAPFVSGVYVESNAPVDGGRTTTDGVYSTEILLQGGGTGAYGGYVGGVYSNGKNNNEYCLTFQGDVGNLEIGPMGTGNHGSAAIFNSATGDGICYSRPKIATNGHDVVEHDSSQSLGRTYQDGVLYAVDDQIAGVDLTSVTPQWQGEMALSDGSAADVAVGTLATANGAGGGWVAPTESSITFH